MRLAGWLGLAGLAACSFLIAAGAAGSASSLVPASRGGFPGWLAGPLSVFDLHLGRAAVGALLLGMCVGYALVLASAGRLGARPVVAGILVTHLIFLAGPPLFSADVFGYIAFARLGALHHVDPYSHGAVAAPHDPVFQFLGWHHLTSPYGPLFTVASYVLVPLGVAGSLWAFKAIAAACSLGIVALVARLAELRGLAASRAMALVGLNPLLLVYGLGGAHNDFLVMLVVLGGIAAAVRGREGAGGAVVVGASAMKASAALFVPFMVVGSQRRRAVLAGMAAALLVAGVIAVAAFGAHAAGFAGQVRLQQHLVAGSSVPNRVGELLGLGGLTHGLRAVAVAGFAAAFLVALARARHGDWITSAGWATLALLVTSAWLLPWYVIWLLPLAAVSASRRLEGATLAFCAYVVVTRVPFLLG